MNDFAPFSIARLPRIVFGEGTVAQLPAEVATLGRKVLIVTGAKSFRESARWDPLINGLAERGVAWEVFGVTDEPSPELVDDAVSRYAGQGFEVVLGVGGGSALDAAKAIAGLLPVERSVMDYLEGVGPELTYTGPALPFVAAPTTAGTGSEATKNAVLSRRGSDGFKKSFRDDQLVARVAVVDPDLLATCPKAVMAADGMDAFTQLLESFVSLKANPMTDALAWSGLQAFRDGFFEALDGAPAGRSRTAYASLLSGVCLAQTGLGSVHGLASPLGAFFPIPHGVVCGTLVAEATRVNLAALADRDPENAAVAKYARVGRLLARDVHLKQDAALDALASELSAWTARLDLQRLSAYGLAEADVPRIVDNSRGSSMKTNPLILEDAEITEILKRRL